VVSFKIDDLKDGPLVVPYCGVALLADSDARDYATTAAAQKAQGSKTLYERVTDLPEQTWTAAWQGIPRKKSRIYFPMGLDGGRQRFRLNADGSVEFRSNDHYLQARPGADTSRLALEKAPVQFEL